MKYYPSHSLQLDLITFNNFITNGTKFKDFKQFIECQYGAIKYRATLEKNYKDPNSIIDEHGVLLPAIKKMLINLNVMREENLSEISKQYSGKNFYDILAELSKNGNPQASYYLTLIEEQFLRKSRKRLLISTMITGLGFCTAAGIYIAAKGVDPVMTEINGPSALHVAIPFITPALNLAIAFGYFLYIVYDNYNNKITRNDKIQKIGFSFASSAINIAGYSLLLASAGIMTPIAGALLVVKEAIETFKEFLFWWRALRCPRSLIDIDDNLPKQKKNILIHRQYARNEYNQKKHRNGALINLTSAILITVVTTVLIAFPPAGLLVLGKIAIAAMIIGLIGSVILVKKWAHKRNEEKQLKNLQKITKEIPYSYAYDYVLHTPLTTDEIKINTLYLYCTSNGLGYTVYEGRDNDNKKIITRKTISVESLNDLKLTPVEQKNLHKIVKYLQTHPMLDYIPEHLHSTLMKVTGFNLRKNIDPLSKPLTNLMPQVSNPPKIKKNLNAKSLQDQNITKNSGTKTPKNCKANSFTQNKPLHAKQVLSILPTGEEASQQKKQWKQKNKFFSKNSTESLDPIEYGALNKYSAD